MKTTRSIHWLLACSLAGLLLLALPLRAADEVTTALQKGLFEEEANQNLDAAIKAYQAVLERHDEQRKLAATALFRLGECYRKLGRTNDAVAQYERLLRDYSDQSALVTLSRQNLAGLNAGVSSTRTAGSGRGSTEELAAVQAEHLALSSLHDRLNTLSRTELLKVLPTTVPDEALDKLLQSRRFEEQRQAQLSQTYGAQSTEIKASVAALATIDRQMGERVDGVMAGLKLRLDSLKTQINQSKAAEQSTFDQRLKAVTTAAATNEEENEVRRIQALIKDSPDLINARRGPDTPLLKAARSGQLVVARFLLENKADPNLGDESGSTPLIGAATAGHRGMCELLLKNGADPDRKGQLSRTALHSAAYQGYRSVVEVLLDNKASVDAQDHYGGSPLCDATARGFLSIAQLLLERGANPNLARSRDPNQSTSPSSPYEKDYSSGAPLHFAVQRGSQPLLELLLTHKAEVNLRRSFGSFSPLDLAANLGDTNLALALIKAGAEVNAAPSDGTANGWTPLIRAANRADPPMVALLLAHGANPNARQRSNFDQDDRYYTSLHMLAYTQDKARTAAVAEMLLKAKADPNLKTDKGWTPLHLAIAYLRPALVEPLLRHGADASVLMPTGDTPLTRAAAEKDGTEIVELLLKAKADPDARAADGRTPLHKAAAQGRREALALLLANKANPNLTDAQGRTPLDYIKEGASANAPGYFSGQIRVAAPQPPIFLGAPGSSPSASSTLTGERADMAEALRKGGAVDWAPRPGQITLFRPSTGKTHVPFTLGTNEWNRHTLYEALAFTEFDRGSGFPFPEWSKLTVIRQDSATGTIRKIPVDLAARLASGDCRQDLPLEWGDLVELPEREHKLSEPWLGWPRPMTHALTNCLARRVTLTVKGQSREIVLRVSTGTVRGAEGYEDAVDLTTPSFRLWTVVHTSGMLLTSSDLSRVKVKRKDPVSGQVQERFFDLRNTSSPTDLWLRDGDEIEVPEK